MFETIAARLERAKADVVENGRLDVAQLEADTAMRVAALIAEATGPGGPPPAPSSSAPDPHAPWTFVPPGGGRGSS